MRQKDFVSLRRVCQRFLALPVLLNSLPAHGSEVTAAILLRDQLRRQGYEQIELRRSGENRLFLFGKLNERRRSVLVDTGWSFTTVSTNAAEKLKALHESDLQSGDPFPGTNEHSTAVQINSLKLGRVVFSNQPALAQHMMFNGQRAPFDVVMGCDFLLRNFAVIDCLNRRLYTRRTALLKEQQTDLENALRKTGFLPVELKRTAPLAFACPVRLNGNPVELLVDTGGVWSCLDADLARNFGFKLLPTPRQITGTGATGKRGFAVTKVSSVELGGAEMRSLNFAALDLEDWGLAAPGAALAGVRGILGGPELVALNAIIDCHGLRLWLKPPSVRR